MDTFFTRYNDEIINTLIVLGVLFILQLIARLIVGAIGKRRDKHMGRIRLVGRYVTVLLALIAVLVEAFILGINIDNIVVVFSSIFAVLGIALFAIWSILSNVTSGVIMFFSFPYKIGDKIQIHDKDHEIIGVIEDIRSFHLYIKTDEGNLMTYPNNLILQKAVSLIEKDAFDK